MPRGGRRAGKPQTAYTNRTDLTPTPLPATAAPNQQYGQAGAQIASQQAVPMGTGPISAGAAAPPPGAAPRGPQPGELPPLDRPTERPDEPLTAGAPFGPGAGPPVDDTVPGQLRALYMLDPNEEIRQLIELYDEGVF